MESFADCLEFAGKYCISVSPAEISELCITGQRVEQILLSGTNFPFCGIFIVLYYYNYWEENYRVYIKSVQIFLTRFFLFMKIDLK